MALIQDGRGKGFVAGVDAENRLLTRAIAIPDVEHAADEGLAFFLTSTFGAADGEEVISIQNTNADKTLHIDRIKCAAVDAGTVVAVWTLFFVTSATAAGGTTITPVNTNISSGIVAAATCFGDAAVTGSLSGTTLGFAVANHDIEAEFILNEALVLSENDVVAITVTDADAPAAVYVSVLMHYADPA